MFSGTSPIGSNNNNSLISANDTNSLLNALGGSSSTFDSVFTQAMSQAKTPAEKMQDALLEVQYNNLNTLYNAVSGDDSSDNSLLSSTNSLAMDLGSVSGQVTQLEQQLGLTPTATSTPQSPSNMNAALGLEAQMLENQNLANFGSDSSSGLNALA
jgi:hypothetical protein